MLHEHAKESEGRSPSTRELDEIFSEAKELRPRLLLDRSRKPAKDFRKSVFKKAKEDTKKNAFNQLFILGFILTTSLIFVTGALMSESIGYPPHLSVDNPDINGHIMAIYRLGFESFMYGMALLSVVLLVIVSILFAILEFISYLIRSFLVVALFKSQTDQRFYEQINAGDKKELMRKVSRWTILIFSVALIAIFIYFINSSLEDLKKFIVRDPLNPDFLFFFGLIGVFISAVVSAPWLYLLSTDKEIKNNTYARSAQKYLAYYIAHILSVPIIIALFAQVFLPLSFDFHQKFLYEQFLYPRFQEKIQDQLNDLQSLEFESEAMQWQQNQVYEYLDEETDRFLLPENFYAGQSVDSYIKAALSALIWMVLSAYLLLFVVPYFILGGWGRGLFYMFILFTSYKTENILSDLAPSWFLLEKESFSAILIVVFFVFANALLFDWIMDANGKKLCASCDTPLEKDARFCSECGFMRD